MERDESSKFSLKDHLFNEERVRFLAGRFREAVRGFDERGFVKRVMSKLDELELKQRIARISQVLDDFLSPKFDRAAKQIEAALPAELDPNLTDDDFGDFIIAPLGDYVARHGIGEWEFDRALELLREITKRFSMEDSIRAFINAHPDRTFEELKRWSRDSNYHARRLVSEGTRPYLPWSRRLTTEPLRAVELLDKLHADSTRYVTRSVANHLNDLAKLAPEVVLERLQDWRTTRKQSPEELDWMTRHALRTLIKRGDGEVMEFLGLAQKPQVKVVRFEVLTSCVKAGEALEFEVELRAERDEALIVDYKIDFMKANGTHAPKVFKAKQMTMKRGELAAFRKSHRLLANATTYRLFPGSHMVTLQINGQPKAQVSFELLV